MLTLPLTVKIFLAREPVDLRKSFDGLSNVTRFVIGQDPLCGHLFVFLNKRRNRVKILVWDRNGFWLLCKRLEKGRFVFQNTQDGKKHVELEAAELSLMLEGYDLRGARIRPRWEPRKVEREAGQSYIS